MILSRKYIDLSAEEFLDIALGEQSKEFPEVVVIFHELHQLRHINKSAYATVVDTFQSTRIKSKNQQVALQKTVIYVWLIRFQLFGSRRLLAELDPAKFWLTFQAALKLMASQFGSDHG